MPDAFFRRFVTGVFFSFTDLIFACFAKEYDFLPISAAMESAESVFGPGFRLPL